MNEHLVLSEDDGLLSAQRDSIKALLSTQPKVEQAILYGSRAKGTYLRGSDIDLTLKGDLSLSELHALELAIDDLLLPYELDLSVYKLINNQDLLDHIERVGKLFYQRA